MKNKRAEWTQGARLIQDIKALAEIKLIIPDEYYRDPENRILEIGLLLEWMLEHVKERKEWEMLRDELRLGLDIAEFILKKLAENR